MAQSVESQAHTAESTAQRRAQKAAGQFEAVLLNMVLGAVEKSFSELPGAKLDEKSQAYSGFAMQALASDLARSGGIGIAKLISGALMQAESRSGAHEGTAVRQVTQEF